MRETISFTALFVLCLLVPSAALPQAVVNESLEKRTIYVDQKTGSDSHPGTATQPFKTIGRAAAVAMANKNAGVGTKVIINPGTYRDAITLPGAQGQPTVPITFEAATQGTVVVSGAVEFQGWMPYSGNQQIYTTAWPHRWGLCTADRGNAPVEQSIVLRREMIFVDGTPLTQVLTLKQMRYPGTFSVDETNEKVYIWPPSGTDLRSADVEVATNPTLFEVNAGRGHSFNGLVVRGITFQYANPCYNQAAVEVIGAAKNILFDEDTFVWNNGQGIALNHPTTNVTIQNSKSNHNGSSGFQSFEGNNVLYDNIEASYNNWRGAQGGYYYWSAAAAHIFSDHNETMNNFTAKFNQTYSIHWDTDAQNITVNGLYSANNMVGPLFEKSEGPLTFANSQLCLSESQHAGYAGFVVRNSSNVTLNNNVFYNNNSAELLITGIAGGVPVTNWETGQNYNLITKNLTFENNVVVAAGDAQVFANGYLGGSDWLQFVTTLKSDHNTWWQGSNKSAFSVPAPRAGTKLNFNAWQTSTAQDFHSKWSAPSGSPASACTQPADGPDFWVTVTTNEAATNKSGDASFDLATSSLGGLGGRVTLTADSDIPNANVSFSPSNVATSGSSVLTVHTTAQTPRGSHTLTVLANVGDITRTLTLTVTK